MRIIGVTVLGTAYCAYAFVFMEWLFFATKLSFLSVLNIAQRFAVLGVSALPLLVPGLVLAFATALLSRPLRKSRWGPGVRALVPAAILGVLFVLMADNFANTMFGYGLLHTEGPGRLVGILVVALLFWMASRAARAGLGFLDDCSLRRAALPAVILAGCTALALVAIDPGESTTSDWAVRLTSPPERRPNILIISSDGLNVTHMSCYGYERDTTPYLRELAPRMLLCESAFSNCAHTGGALISLLTGRIPTDHRVVYAPDVLRDTDAFLHLPGILRKHGYSSLQVTVRHYADAYDFNLRNGFDRANFRDEHEVLDVPRLASVLGEDASILWARITDRVRTRVVHLVTNRPLSNAYDEVNPDRGASFSDAARVTELMRFVDESDGPFFAQLHLMGTHGKTFAPLERRFSKGQEQTEPWMRDFYDDAMHDFDDWSRTILDGLEARGILDDTVVVFCSDHTMRFRPLNHVPLMFLFPEGEHARRVTSNTQLVDVAPTLLDYLGLAVPSWMEGVSLIEGDPDPLRPIYSAMVPPDFQHRGRVADPPFRTVGILSAVVCDERFVIRTTTTEFLHDPLKRSVTSCDSAAIPSPADMRRTMVQHLREAGYDVSSLHELER